MMKNFRQLRRLETTFEEPDPEKFPDISLAVVKLIGRGEYALDPPGSEPPTMTDEPRRLSAVPPSMSGSAPPASASTGTQVAVAAPLSGSQAHSLSFWLTDWAGNTTGTLHAHVRIDFREDCLLLVIGRVAVICDDDGAPAPVFP